MSMKTPRDRYTSARTGFAALIFLFLMEVSEDIYDTLSLCLYFRYSQRKVLGSQNTIQFTGHLGCTVRPQGTRSFVS